MSKFQYTDADGGRLAIKPLPGVPYILLMTDLEGSAVPVDRVEEVVAGLRDMTRQAGGQVLKPCVCGAPTDARTVHRADGPCHLPEPLAAAVLTLAERQFLSFALDLASDRMVSDGGFTDEDHAALDRFRKLAEEAGA